MCTNWTNKEQASGCWSLPSIFGGPMGRMLLAVLSMVGRAELSWQSVYPKLRWVVLLFVC